MGDRMLTSRQFAKMIGVSQATVSRALNGRESVAEETRRYIEQKAEEYGFVLNSQARSLRTQHTGNVGVLFPLSFDSLSRNLMFTHIYDNLQRELLERGFDIMVVGDYGSSPGGAFERVVKSRKVDALINLRPQLLSQEIELIERNSIPFVSLHSARQGGSAFHQLILDEESAGEQVGRLLGRSAGDRFVYIAVDDKPPREESRLRGFVKGLAVCGVRLETENVIVCPLSMSAARERTLEHAHLFTQGRASVFVYNDMMALGVLNALTELGVRVPEQVQLASVDDIPLASWLSPGLTTMRTPVERMVREGCDLLIRLMNGEEIAPATAMYTPQLVLRETTRGGGQEEIKP